jgi:hypothetical protein
MRPTGLESIRAIQSALVEVIGPELTSAFAQDAAQTLQMLLESIAAEWDTAAEDLRADNETLGRLLSASRDAVESAMPGNERLRSLISQIKECLSEDEGGSISLSALTSRNNALRETLEQTLVAFEDISGEAGFAYIEPVRSEMFSHLRDTATRGWSFWDVSSFRGKIAAIQSATGRDDAPHARAVE